ncbi:hypothetical protein SAZ11_16365 [Streptomyces sp. FXJ1.4098]|nr:hypothetical protein [Streptomyces sp. FXJ1.4098]
MSGGGGSKEPDLKLDKEALQDITKGLRAAISELKDIGSATDAVMGSGFEELSLTSMEAGHNGLAKDFEDFCERWEWGVRGLIQDANKLAKKVGLAAGMQWEEDRYIEGTYKVVANSVAGNPHLSEEEVTQKEWGELFSGTPGARTTARSRTRRRARRSRAPGRPRATRSVAPAVSPSTPSRPLSKVATRLAVRADGWTRPDARLGR